jgi:hypothetical protein
MAFRHRFVSPARRRNVARRLEGRIAVDTARIGLATARRFATGARVLVTGRRRAQGNVKETFQGDMS